MNDNDTYRNITLVASDIDNGITRNDSIYDLVLATVTVIGNADEIKGSDITDTRLDSNRCGAVCGAIQGVTSMDLFTQVQELIKETKELNEEAMQNNRNAWNEWFATIKDILDGDTAGKLANRITELEFMMLNNHFYTPLLVDAITQVVDENENTILADWTYKVK